MFCLPAEQIDTARGDLLPFLWRFEDETRAVSAEQILAAAQASKQQIWCSWKTGIDSVAVTEILETPKGKVCQIVAYVGDRTGMNDLLAAGSEWAKSIGCVALRVSGRKGWLRFGFKQTGIVAEREL